MSDDDNCVKREKGEVTKWKNESNECIECRRNDESGVFAIPLCKNDDNVVVCKSGKCIYEEDLNEMKWSVELEIRTEEIILFTHDEILHELSNITNTSVNDITIGIEYDEHRMICRIVVNVKDEKQASIIEEVTKEC